jgi:hypothetical protein
MVRTARRWIPGPADIRPAAHIPKSEGQARMSNGGGSKRNRGGGGGGGGGGGQQRRRRSGGGGGGGGNRPQAPNGPAMTALGESTYEAVFDHGGSGYGVWFDGVVRDDPMYKQFWKGTGTRPLYVRIEEDKIILLKELDRELPPMPAQASDDAADGLVDADVDAAIEEAVAEAMAAAEAAAGDGEDRTYSPEEAAALFAAGGEGGDAAEAPAEAEAAPEAEDKPKKRVTRKKAAPKAEAEDAE